MGWTSPRLDLFSTVRPAPAMYKQIFLPMTSKLTAAHNDIIVTQLHKLPNSFKVAIKNFAMYDVL